MPLPWTGKYRKVVADQREYIGVVEAIRGKPLPKGAEVHHLDHNPHNNAPTNLLVCQDKAYHRLIECRERALKACGHAGWRKCAYCKQYDDPANLSSCKSGAYRQLYHQECSRARLGDMNAKRRASHQRQLDEAYAAGYAAGRADALAEKVA